VFIADDHFVGSAHPDSYHTAFHAPGYVLEHWSIWFDVVAYLPLGAVSQDLVVLRRGAEPRQRPPSTSSNDDVRQPRTSEQVDAAIETLATRIFGRAAATRRRWWWRPGRTDGSRLRTDMEIVDVLRELSRQIAARDREVSMLRVGIYEQGRRMSLIAQQLRDELSESREERVSPPERAR
jgi:hypothetical protein